MFLWFPVFLLEEVLERTGALNTSFDVPPRSLGGRLLCAWNWDLVVELLLALAVPCFLASLVLVIHQRLQTHGKRA